jgi:hypothetical protein
MRYIIIFLTLLTACQQATKSLQQQVFDDFQLGRLNSWNEARRKVDVPIFSYESGDTIELLSELRMLKRPKSGVIPISLTPKDFIMLDSGTVIKFSGSENNLAINVIVSVDTTTYHGVIWTNEFLDAQWGKVMADKKRMFFLDELNDQQQTNQIELSNKYKISKDSISLLIENEYFERTGKTWINN